MVVASALVTAHALGLQLTRGALASLSARAEQYIGVMSGGMDQTASSVSEAGNALHIEVRKQSSSEFSYTHSAFIIVLHTSTRSALQKHSVCSCD
jgi:galactokinase